MRNNRSWIFVLALMLACLALGYGYRTSPVAAQNATTGMAAPQLAGTGAPTYACNATNLPNVLYVQTDSTNGKFWQCTGAGGWIHFPGPVASATDPQSFTGGVLSVGTVQTHTITIPGVVMGLGATCAFTSNPGSTYIRADAYVTAPNTVTASITVLSPPAVGTGGVVTLASTVTALSSTLPPLRCEVY